MSVAYVVVTVLAAVLVGLSAVVLLLRVEWIVRSFDAYGVPRPWWQWLAAAKAAGSAGLLIGLAVPVIGVLAGICLVLYFIGALVTVLRARWYSHVPAPLMYAAPVVASLVLGAAS